MNERIVDVYFIRDFYIVFLIILFVVLVLSICQYSNTKKAVLKACSFLGLVISLATGFYLGVRADDVGKDTLTYLEFFNDLSIGGDILGRGDIAFYASMWIFAAFLTWRLFLIFCGIVYVGGAYLGFKRLFGPLSIYSILLFIISPNFFQFGINLMRNGVAASLFILALSYCQNDKKKFWYMIIASVCCHISMLLPFATFLLFRKYNTINKTLIIWCVSFLTFLIGVNATSLLGRFLPEYIMLRYISRVAADSSATLFNFLLYGASPVFAGLYFVYKRKYSDPLYTQLLNVYIFLNALYIQFIGIEDALRFAYLSEFLMPLLLLYPLLKKPVIKYQSVYLSTALLIVFIIKSIKILSIS